jgi:DNA-binding MarR family transcriptional regulator
VPDDAPVTPADTDFLSFADFAVREAGRRLPELDTDALRLVLMLYRVTSVVTYDLEAAVHRPRGWSWPGFRLMYVLWIGGPMEGKRAAEVSGMSRAAVSALANTLEKQGSLVREPSVHDGRAVTLRLTEAGERAMAEAYLDHNAREQKWAGALTSEETREMARLLGKIAAHADGEWVRRRD